MAVFFKENKCLFLSWIEQQFLFQILYRRATRTRKNAYRYNLRLRMSVVNGLKMMLIHYSTNKQVIQAFVSPGFPG
jgi:hypothetical protein